MNCWIKDIRGFASWVCMNLSCWIIPTTAFVPKSHVVFAGAQYIGQTTAAPNVVKYGATSHSAFRWLSGILVWRYGLIISGVISTSLTYFVACICFMHMRRHPDFAAHVQAMRPPFRLPLPAETSICRWKADLDEFMHKLFRKDKYDLVPHGSWVDGQSLRE